MVLLLSLVMAGRRHARGRTAVFAALLAAVVINDLVLGRELLGLLTVP